MFESKLNRGIASGYAPLDGTTKIPNQYLNTSSLNSVSASYANTASYALTASYVDAANVAGLNPSQIVSGSATASISPGLFNVNTNTNIQGDLTASNALFTGTITAQRLVTQVITSSTEFITGSTRFGSFLTDTHQFTGSVSITGSLAFESGTAALTSSWALNVPASGVVGLNLNSISSGSVTASVNVNSASFQLISGSSTFLFVSNSGVVGINQSDPQFSLDVSGSGRYTNGLQVTGSLLVPTITGSLFGTSSHAVTASLALTASYLPNAVLNKAWFVPFTDPYTTFFIGSNAGVSASYSWDSIFMGSSAGYLASESQESNFIGRVAGGGAWNSRFSNFIGSSAGFEARNSITSNFIGRLAGLNSNDCQATNLIGTSAGNQSTNLYECNFIGSSAGFYAPYVQRSNFIGVQAGYFAATASYSNLIGYRAGRNTITGFGIGRNNVIIGTSITLPDGYQNGINIGGILFGSGAYYDPSTSTNSFSGSANGRVGINQPNPQYSLDVSGSIGLSDVLVLAARHPLPTSNVPTGSLMSSGSNAENKPYYWNGATWTPLF